MIFIQVCFVMVIDDGKSCKLMRTESLVLEVKECISLAFNKTQKPEISIFFGSVATVYIFTIFMAVLPFFLGGEGFSLSNSCLT